LKLIERKFGCPTPGLDVETDIVSAQQIQQLSYLLACIKEGLRLHPPATGYLQKQVPPGGDTLADGRFIPGGTSIAYCAWGLMRSPEALGSIAKIFYSERWLDADPDSLRRLNRHWELGFSTGKWHCLGKDVALLEKALVELIRCYGISMVDSMGPMKSRNFSLFLDTEFRLVITKRS
jgi:cytochrome P450